MRQTTAAPKGTRFDAPESLGDHQIAQVAAAIEGLLSNVGDLGVCLRRKKLSKRMIPKMV